MKYAIEVKGRIFRDIVSNKILTWNTKEEAEKVVEYWDKNKATFNHTVEYIVEKDKKGRNVYITKRTKIDTKVIEVE